ncbi:3-phosphoserine/phosphohydroxythreonine transaminase [Buchnera aphidicola]|uniref:3-phosphoserine/phosphohydroxythreonine transaminase n=1 Tax=Buchnera aphidicola TaxID=9 RepID=UPI0034646F81
MNTQTYNFSAGPAILPREVLKDIKKDFLNWNNIGTSVIEISHRSREFSVIVNNLENSLRDLLNISDQYAVLFLQGGARGQFSAIPMNLLSSKDSADYINSGYWSQQSMLEAKKYCLVDNINVQKMENSTKYILEMKNWKINKKSIYMHYCPNETIEGIAIHEEPNFENKIIIGDFSSYLLSRSIDINKYDLIYASAQKNIGPAGMTVVIIKKNLLTKNNPFLPSILDYKKNFFSQSMFNTPVTFSWYVSSLVLEWMQKKGGIKYFEKINKKKSKLLYQKIDSSEFYNNNIHVNNRSDMNITFNIYDHKLDNLFVQEAHLRGLKFLKGHKVIGGFRASTYNAMPIEGIYQLTEFMTYFEKKFG